MADSRAGQGYSGGRLKAPTVTHDTGIIVRALRCKTMPGLTTSKLYDHQKNPSRNGQTVFKVETESGATGYIAESVLVEALEGWLKKIDAASEQNVEEIRRLFGDEVYRRVRADPSEAGRQLAKLREEAQPQRGAEPLPEDKPRK